MSPSKLIQKFAPVRNSRKNGGADYQSEFSPERKARGKPKAKRVGRQKPKPPAKNKLCVCEKDSINETGEEFIACDGCDVWFHTRCVGQHDVGPMCWLGLSKLPGKKRAHTMAPRLPTRAEAKFTMEHRS
jgi:hypothetical protein